MQYLGWMCAAVIVFLLVRTAYRWGKNDGEADGFKNGFECAKARNYIWEQYINEQV
jgi:hypothetical protein